MDSFEEIWSNILEYVKLNLSSTAATMWINGIEGAEFKDGRIMARVQNDFKCQILREQFTDLFKDAVKEVTGIDLEIVFYTDEQKNTPTNITTPDDIERKETQKNSFQNTIKQFTFENYIVGPSNRLAYESANAVCSAELGTRYNPLFIYGKSGLGKTHIMFAMMNKIRENNPNANIVYVTTENFMNEFLYGIRHNTQESFRDKYRKADALFIDDIQFLNKGEQTQVEFFHTFNDLIQSNSQIVLTSDRPPKEIETLEDRIKTRLESGLIVDVTPPEIETRILIIRQKALEQSVALSDTEINLIAQKVKNNVRQIEGTITKIKAMQTLDGFLSTNQIAQIIKDVESEDMPVAATIDDIISSVSETFGISIADIKSDKRSANIATARNVAMYVIREVLSLSYESIGSEFGGKKHSTVMHSVQNVEKDMNLDTRFKQRVINIIKQFKKD